MKKIIPIVQESSVVPVDLDDKHVKIMEAILPYARSAPQKNLTDLVIKNYTRNIKVRFFLLPEWAKNFPPYNLARLVAVAKQAGYNADAVDLNVKAFRDHKNWNIDFDPWHGSKEWRWIGNSYKEHLHIHLETLLEKHIEQIEKDKIDVIGFSLYYCNEAPTEWMASEIKKRYPHVKIIVGGPQCHAFPPGPEKHFYDYVVSGEGEEMLLDVLGQIESKNSQGRTVLTQEDGVRLNLDNLPTPDYSHFDLSEYEMPNGINAEFSRGCTAKCVFCSETHFWKYRGRNASIVFNEIFEFYNRYGINYVWFLDSLVNGNLKELRAFCKGVIASGMKIRWTGYARCDKRMDFSYMQDLADSGCHMLSYGIESGSNKVLADMDKRVTVEEIEQNLQDGRKVGITAHSNWIIGFPTEEPQDFYESMMLIWRNSSCLSVVAAGHGFTEPPDTIISQNNEKFGMLKSYYLNNWISKDFKNSKVHRQIRLISLNILLGLIPGRSFANFDVTKYRKIMFRDFKISNHIDFEKFDFNIIKPNINPLADSLVNEIWPMLRLLWRARGAYSISIDIDKEKSYNEFGNRLGCDLTANYNFRIDHLGNWYADFKFDFKQDDNAWRYQDYSRESSMSARRARILAIPSSNGDSVWNNDVYKKHMEQLEEHKKLDFSFSYNFKNNGQW